MRLPSWAVNSNGTNPLNGAHLSEIRPCREPPCPGPLCPARRYRGQRYRGQRYRGQLYRGQLYRGRRYRGRRYRAAGDPHGHPIGFGRPTLTPCRAPRCLARPCLARPCLARPCPEIGGGKHDRPEKWIPRQLAGRALTTVPTARRLTRVEANRG